MNSKKLKEVSDKVRKGNANKIEEMIYNYYIGSCGI